MTRDLDNLSTLYKAAFGCLPESIVPMVSHASPRRRYRLRSSNHSAVGAVNDSQSENESFVYLAKHFRSKGLNVPEIYGYSVEDGVILEEDLGDTTLFDLVQKQSPSRLKLYKLAVTTLARFQVLGIQGLDLSRISPDNSTKSLFFKNLCSSFKHDFVERAQLKHDPFKLEMNLNSLQSQLLELRGDFFLHRDFQSRNIMVRGEAITVIDFQGGCCGPLAYDLVSLLFQVSTNLTQEERSYLISEYLEEVSQLTPLDRSLFLDSLPLVILARMLQVLGVYGRQGLGLGKEYFRNNISRAVATALSLLSPSADLFPELRNTLLDWRSS